MCGTLAERGFAADSRDKRWTFRSGLTTHEIRTACPLCQLRFPAPTASSAIALVEGEQVRHLCFAFFLEIAEEELRGSRQAFALPVRHVPAPP